MTFTVQADRMLIRAGAHSVRYGLITFTAPDAPRTAARQPVNVALVIDRSGSMGGRKIDLAREAVVRALQMLRPEDRFALVCYDHEVEVIVPSTAATPEAVRNALDRVKALQARGSTDLCGGWLRGCEQIAQHLRPDQIGRCLLMTDGLANHGITDRGEIARHAAELRKRAVQTSTFGIGADYDERLLGDMAEAGAGHAYHIETPVQIADYLTSEIGETLETVARDVAIVVRPPDGASVDTPNRFPVIHGADGVRIQLGDLVSRQEVSLVVRLKFPTGREGATVTAVFGVDDPAGVLRAPETDIVWTFGEHAANDAQPRNVVVDRAVARLYAAQAEAEALELNRIGRYDEARARLDATARRIREYAGKDPELLEIIEGLTERQVVYQHVMSPMARKAEYYRSYQIASMRTADGRAHRRPNS